MRVRFDHLWFVQLEEQGLGFSPAPSCNWKKDSGAISGTPARNLFQLNLFSQKISYTEAFQFLQIFCQRMRQMDMAGENCNWSVFNHWTCAMNRVLAERVFEAVWPWGHNRKEAVRTEFLQAQGRDYDCFPFRVIILSVLSFWQWHFYFVVRHIRVLFSTDVAAMGVDTPDLNIGVSYTLLYIFLSWLFKIGL